MILPADLQPGDVFEHIEQCRGLNSSWAGMCLWNIRMFVMKLVYSVCMTTQIFGTKDLLKYGILAT